MLKYSKDNIKKGIILYHNLVNKKNIIRSFIKRNLKYIFNVDFGLETTISEQKKILEDINNKYILRSITKSKIFGEQYIIIINNN